jgi:uncharacterized protein with HEPN domain
MSKRDNAFYIVDIFIACDKIERYIQKISNPEALKWNELVWDATLRELEIIGEATNRLIQYGFLEREEYRKIVDFRNIIAHAYFGIDEEEVWYVVKTKLPIFCQTLQSMVHEVSLDLTKAIEAAKEEHSKNIHIVTLLEHIAE